MSESKDGVWYRQADKQLGKNVVVCQLMLARVAIRVVPDRAARSEKVGFLRGMHSCPARQRQGSGALPEGRWTRRARRSAWPQCTARWAGRTGRSPHASARTTRWSGCGWPASARGHLCHPLAEEPWPARKNAAQDAPEDHGAVHRGPQAAGYDANYRTYKPLCRYAKRRWNTASRMRALRAFKEVALRSKIPRPEHPLAASPGSASPPEEDEEGAGGERQGGKGA